MVIWATADSLVHLLGIISVLRCAPVLDSTSQLCRIRSRILGPLRDTRFTVGQHSVPATPAQVRPGTPASLRTPYGTLAGQASARISDGCSPVLACCPPTLRAGSWL